MLDRRPTTTGDENSRAHVLLPRVHSLFGAGIDLEAELRKVLPSRYVLTGTLGAGGQGSVYKGSCDGRPAALKVFAPSTDRRRVEREIDILQRIQCPHLVQVFAAETVRIMSVEVSLIAYELHTGGDLMVHLQNSAPGLAPEIVGTIGREVGTALDALWAHRIVHRDVKPANIVRAADDRYVLVDVGLARHLDRSAVSGLGTAPGTPGFMAPEQADGRRNLTIHADAFSLGVTLYFLAAKRHPFQGQQAVIMRRLVPEKLERLRPDMPAPLCRAIDRLLSLRPSNRPNALATEFANF